MIDRTPHIEFCTRFLVRNNVQDVVDWISAFNEALIDMEEEGVLFGLNTPAEQAIIDLGVTPIPNTHRLGCQVFWHSVSNGISIIVSNGTDDGETEIAVQVIQCCLQLADSNESVVFEWAEHCDHAIPTGFGGGVAVITKENISIASTAGLAPLLTNMEKLSHYTEDYDTIMAEGVEITIRVGVAYTSSEGKKTSVAVSNINDITLMPDGRTVLILGGGKKRYAKESVAELKARAEEARRNLDALNTALMLLRAASE